MKSIFYPYEVSKAIDVYDFSVLAAEVSNPILSEAPESSGGFLCTRELFIRYSLTLHDVKLLIAHCCQILTGREQFCQKICQTLIPASERCERSRYLPTVFADTMWELLVDCWHQDPENRPDMGDVVQRLREM
jgi:hypothetical protein